MYSWAEIKAFFEKHERALGFAFLVSGFIFDTLTLQRVDVLLDNLVLLFYLLIVAVSIIVISLGLGKFSYFAPYAMQFAIGGLFSGLIVFYFRSASLTVNWPFLLLLAIFFIGNEFFRKHYELLAFRLSVFFIVVFSYFIFSLPVLFHRLGVDVFILSGLLSLVVALALVWIIRKIAPDRAHGHYAAIALAIGGIYVIFNIFYFNNVIPPIPLALKDVGVYHRVERVTDGYVGYVEKRPWYDLFGGNKLRLASGEAAYVYSAVFAPTRLESDIYHRWSYYDEIEKQWIDAGRIGFPLVGGRDGGYRGYSVKSGMFPGAWRVDVVTERDQIIGRMKFRVLRVEKKPTLELKEL